MGIFTVTYTPEKFIWAVATPGWRKDLHTIIRNSKNKKILGSAFGDPKMFMINDKKVKLVEGNFLCVHPKLRSKRLA